MSGLVMQWVAAACLVCELGASLHSAFPWVTVALETASIGLSITSSVLLFTSQSSGSLDVGAADLGSTALYLVAYLMSMVISGFVILNVLSYRREVEDLLVRQQRELERRSAIWAIAPTLWCIATPAVLYFIGGMDPSEFVPLKVPVASQVIVSIGVACLGAGVMLTSLVIFKKKDDRSKPATEFSSSRFRDASLLFALAVLLAATGAIFAGFIIGNSSGAFPLEAGAYFMAIVTTALGPYTHHTMCRMKLHWERRAAAARDWEEYQEQRKAYDDLPRVLKFFQGPPNPPTTALPASDLP